MILTAALLFITICLFLTHAHITIKNNRLTKMLKNIPQITRLPFIGTTYRYINKNMFVSSQEIVSEIGLPNVTWIGTKPYYSTKDPNEIKIILNNSLEKSDTYKYLKMFFGKSILIAPVNEWKRNRKIFSRGFNQNILDEYVPIFNKKSHVLVDILKNKNDPSNLYDLFQSYAMDTFFETTIGIDYKMQEKQNMKFVKILSRIQNITIQRLFRPLMYWDFIFNNFGQGKELNQAITDVRNFLSEIIKKERQEPHKNTTNKTALIDILLNQNEKDYFSDDHIIFEITLFWSAASDTTGAALAFACTLLGMNKHIQDKLYKEIAQYIKNYKNINYSDLLHLKYLEMVINETLRIIPVVPYIGRIATEDINLGKTVIPKGTDLLISIYNLHHDEQFYNDPEKFIPERFAPEEIVKRPQYSFIPFSTGPRNCIGWKYAMMLMKTALLNIVLNFEINSDHISIDDFKLESDVVMRPTKDLYCTFVERTCIK